jgi:hypothetical protein
MKQNKMEDNLLQGQEGRQSNPQDYVNASLIFARTLGLILKEGDGIVCHLPKGMKLEENVDKVIVFKHNEQVHIYKCEEDLPEGTPVTVSESK